METKTRRVQKVLVDEEVYLMVHVVDEAERGDAAGLQVEVFLHALLRGEGHGVAIVEVMDLRLQFKCKIMEKSIIWQWLEENL